MWKKVFGIIITICVTSMYYFPFEFFALPGYNTKKIMAAVGIVFCVFILLRKRDTTVPRNLLPIFIWAAAVSLVGLASMTYNRTIDDAYSGYISSMAVWLSASFVVCCMIKMVHSKVTLELLGKYLIVVCVLQCIEAIMIDQIPEFQRIVDTYINIDQRTLKEVKRLYGIGASLDVAGMRFSLVLTMIAYLTHKHKAELSNWDIALYFLAFCIITVIGSMIARTTYVGVGLGLVYFVAAHNFQGVYMGRDTIRTLGVMLGIVIVTIVVCVYEYQTNDSIRHWTRFAFEGFFNLFEQGEWSIASNSTLKSMYVWPENFKTWVIGDGYFSNPYWSDPNYVWQGQATRGYYMGTDVGYLRFIFYFGLIGLLTFTLFFVKCCTTCCRLMPDDKWLFIFILAAGFVVWFKVATDVFLAFALFICVGNMQDTAPELEAEPEGEAGPEAGAEGEASDNAAAQINENQ